MDTCNVERAGTEDVSNRFSVQAGETEASGAIAQRKRPTPTQRQIVALANLDVDDLVAKALEALHCLNRRAKKLRDTRNVYRRATFARAVAFRKEEIYELKDAFLDALILAGRCRVETFTVKVESRRMTCHDCGHEWVGDAECYHCGGWGSAPQETHRWYLVDCGDGHRFHQPFLSPHAAAFAVEGEPHDPTQPQREIPEINLTIEAQMEVVRMATKALHQIPIPSAAGSIRPEAKPPSQKLGPTTMTAADTEEGV